MRVWSVGTWSKLAACGAVVCLLAGLGLRLAPLASQEPTPAGAGVAKKGPAVKPAPGGAGATAGEKIRTPLFDGWPKPEYVLVFSGQQMGYIEPCGCSGLENQKGGLARRHTFLKELTSRGWTVVPLDVGNQVRKFGRQQEIKFERTATALRLMKYQAVTFGNDDLKLGTGEIFGAAVPNPDDKTFLSSNVALIDRDLTPTHEILQVGNRKIGVTGVLGDTFEKQLPAKGDVVHKPSQVALAAVVPELVSKKCELNILLAHTKTLEESKLLAQKFPQFQLVVTAGGFGEPRFEMEKLSPTSYLIEVGQKGMYLAVVGVFSDPKRPFRYQRVPLDDRFADSPEMMDNLKQYQKMLQLEGFDRLGIKAQPHPTSKHRFVGTEKCGECHTKALAIWQSTPHAHATESIVAPPQRFAVARHYDPECLSCHVTGWDPQNIHPFNSGYQTLKDTPHLQHNGCENCHGPGSGHVAAEEDPAKVKPADRAALRAAMRLPLAGGVAEKKCLECHDLDNSPDFHKKGAFEAYWKKVEHKGKD